MISSWLMRTGECVLSKRKGRKLKNNLCYFTFLYGGKIRNKSCARNEKLHSHCEVLKWLRTYGHCLCIASNYTCKSVFCTGSSFRCQCGPSHASFSLKISIHYTHTDKHFCLIKGIGYNFPHLYFISKTITKGGFVRNTEINSICLPLDLYTCTRIVSSPQCSALWWHGSEPLLLLLCTTSYSDRRLA